MFEHQFLFYFYNDSRLDLVFILHLIKVLLQMHISFLNDRLTLKLLIIIAKM